MAQRPGFGLVETVVMAICLVAVAGVSLPVLVQSRDAAQVDECKNNMREIGLATHNYVSAWSKFPPATLGYEEVVDFESWNEDTESEHYWKNVQNTSALFLIAPYMELTEYTREVSPVASDLERTLKQINAANPHSKIGWQGEIEGVDKAMVRVVEKFTCPSDSINDLSLQAAVTSQPCNPQEPLMGSHDESRDIAIQNWPNEEQSLGLTNYLGCIGVTGQSWKTGHDSDRWRGVMAPRVGSRFRNITDGLSNTIMWGESLGEIFEEERSSGMSWVWGGGGRIVGNWEYDADAHPQDEKIGMLGDELFSSVVGFGSTHEGAVVFAISDGSVHAISKTIDREVLYKLAGRADGNVVRGWK